MTVANMLMRLLVGLAMFAATITGLFWLGFTLYEISRLYTLHRFRRAQVDEHGSDSLR